MYLLVMDSTRSEGASSLVSKERSLPVSKDHSSLCRRIAVTGALVVGVVKFSSLVIVT